MKLGFSRRWLPLALVALVALFIAAPGAFGFPGGITKDTAPDAATFNEIGCLACHGEPIGHAEPAAGSYRFVSWQMQDDTGGPPLGNVYQHDMTYTITIELDEQNAPDANNRAGFSLRADAGTLQAVAGESQVSGDGTQATHVDASRTNWTVQWTAPEEGPVVFDLFVNDVNGVNGADAGDQVHWVGWWMTDEDHARPGAVEEHEPHVGVPLPQYWLGLIALAGMVGIMVFGFVYMKYMSPHHSDQKDR